MVKYSRIDIDFDAIHGGVSLLVIWGVDWKKDEEKGGSEALDN